MKIIRKFQNYLNKLNIDNICKKYDIKNYIINSDGSIDVNDSVHFNLNNLEKIPLDFNNVQYSFICEYNILNSLKGSPSYVGINFSSYNNKLVDLNYSPRYIGGNFNVHNNKIESFHGCPDYIGGDFNIVYNNIRTFDGFPKYVGGDLYCMGNPIHNIWRLFRDKSKIELFNDYDIIRDNGKSVIIDRLNAFLEEINSFYKAKDIKDYNNY